MINKFVCSANSVKMRGGCLFCWYWWNWHHCL